MQKKGLNRGDAAQKIFERLKKGPATPKQLQDDLGLIPSTVSHNLKKESSLFKLGLIEQLKDGRYVAKRDSSEETRFIEYYDLLRRKLLRNPSSEELAGLIKKTPPVTRTLLFKYIPGYREPTEEEIVSAARVLCKVIVWGSLNLPTKKDFFEKGISKVVVEGIAQEMLNEIMEQKLTISLDDAKKYIIEFPEMKPDITELDGIEKIVYKVNWSNEAKSVLSAINILNCSSRILIPRKFDEKEDKFLFSGRDPWEEYYHAEQLADIYVPSQGMIDRLVELVGLSHLQCEVLQILKKFCQNAVEVDQLNEDNKNKIVSRLLDVAFFNNPDLGDYEKGADVVKERNIAFDIIEMLDVRTKSVIDISMKFVNRCLDYPRNCDYGGPDFNKVGKWLA
jgi:DNA-binding transcriptional ArsR family regulator